MRNERLLRDAWFNVSNHKVVSAFVLGWAMPSSKQRPTHAGTPLEFMKWIVPFPGVALNGNPGLKDATPLVLEEEAHCER